MPRREVLEISPDQIEIARRMHEKLRVWRITERALENLSARYPGFDLDACLVKAAAVNALYSTYVLAITRMGQHVHDVLQREHFRTITQDNSTALVDQRSLAEWTTS
jgi:hypothetical protein